MSRYVTVRMTVLQAKCLWHCAGQMADDCACQVYETGDYDHAGGMSKRECRAFLQGLEKLRKAISEKGGFDP